MLRDKPMIIRPKKIGTLPLYPFILMLELPPIINMAIVIIKKPIKMMPRFCILAVRRYMNGQEVAYKIAGIAYVAPIMLSVYPKSCK